MMSSGKPKYQPWDVVVVPFPYADRRTTSVRPAVIVSAEALSNHAGKYFLAMITSAGNPPMYGDVAISDLKTVGLPVASVVRPTKVATLEQSSFHRRVGTLRREDRKQVRLRLQEFLARA